MALRAAFGESACAQHLGFGFYLAAVTQTAEQVSFNKLPK